MNNFYKHPKYGHVYGESMKTPVGRIAFPSLKEPKAYQAKPGEQQQAPRYEVTLILDKDAEDTQAFMDALSEMAGGMLELFNEGSSTSISINALVKDGDDAKKFDPEKYPYYANSWILALRNAQLPTLVFADKSPCDWAVFPGGVRCRAVITPLITSRGMSYKLEVLQFVQDDGRRFGGGSRPDHTALLDAIGDDESAPVSAPEETSSETEVEEVAAAPTPAPAVAPKTAAPRAATPAVKAAPVAAPKAAVKAPAATPGKTVAAAPKAAAVTPTSEATQVQPKKPSPAQGKAAAVNLL